MDEGCRIVPFFSAAHAPFVEAALCAGGCEAELVCAGGEEMVHRGLAAVNNDACYAAILAAGRVLSACEQGRGAAQVAVPALCHACRADDMPYLVARALNGAGTAGRGGAVVADAVEALRPGGLLPLLDKSAQRLLAAALVVGDAFLHIETHVRPRLPVDRRAAFGAALAGERERALRFFAEGAAAASPFDALTAIRAAEQALLPFASSSGAGMAPPAVGIVGSAPPVFDAGINNGLVAHIEAEGCEAVLPYLAPLVSYALRADGVSCTLADELDSLAPRLGGSELRRPCPTLAELERFGTAVVPDTITQGAGWAIAGQARFFWEQGIRNVVYASVFGCLAGHVVGQGIMKRLRAHCPDINLASVEYDPGTSPVNQTNRLKLLTTIAKRPRP